MELRVATAAGDPDLEASVAGQLAEANGIHVVLRCVDAVEVHAALRGAALDALIVVGWASWFDRRTLDEAHEAGVRLIALASTEAERERMTAWFPVALPPHSSAHEIYLACLERTSPEFENRFPPEPERGTVVAVWGAKGGPGRTRTAVEVTSALGGRSLLIDADLYGGDVTQLFGMVDNAPNIVWATQQARKGLVDLERVTTRIRRGFKGSFAVLPGITRAEHWREVSVRGWPPLLAKTRESFDWVVVDTGFCIERARPFPGETSIQERNEIARAAISLAGVVVAVCRADVVGVTRFCTSFPSLQELIGETPVIVALNRVRGAEAGELAGLLRARLPIRRLVPVPDLSDEIARAERDARALGEARRSARVSGAWREIARAVREVVAQVPRVADSVAS